jgi:uncharacterized hydrophobic protein (TIGR00341 family)
MKLIEVVADPGEEDTIRAVADKNESRYYRLGAKAEDGMQPIRFVVGDDKLQSTLDMLQSLVGKRPEARIMVLPVETFLPRPPEAERRREDEAVAAREALYDQVEKSARVDLNFLVLIALSTLVAAIGLVEDNVAVVIGAMVIAPLLGPNLALALGTALGDVALMRKALASSAAGLALALALSVAIGFAWSFDPGSHELLARTDVKLDSIVLALASGAAAVLSLTTGLSSVLVGVMVAVALLPPTAALGLMLGHGRLDLALGAALLLAVNIVAVNLAAKVVLLLKGIQPRTWYEKARARRAMAIYLVGWVATLAVLAAVIYLRDAVAPGTG